MCFYVLSHRVLGKLIAWRWNSYTQNNEIQWGYVLYQEAAQPRRLRLSVRQEEEQNIHTWVVLEENVMQATGQMVNTECQLWTNLPWVSILESSLLA